MGRDFENPETRELAIAVLRVAVASSKGAALEGCAFALAVLASTATDYAQGEQMMDVESEEYEELLAELLSHAIEIIRARHKEGRPVLELLPGGKV